MDHRVKYESAVFVVDLKGIRLTEDQKKIIDEQLKVVIRRNIISIHRSKYLSINEDLLSNKKYYDINFSILGIWINELKLTMHKKLNGLLKAM